MELSILIILLIIIFILAFPFTKFSKNLAPYEDKFISSTFQKIFEDENKARLSYWIFRFIIIILIVLLFIVFNNMLNKEESPNAAPDISQGFGGENSTPQIGGTKPSEEKMSEDKNKVNPSSQEEGIKSLYPTNLDPTIQLIENPRRYKYFTDYDDKYVELFIGKTTEEFQLKSSDGKISESSVSDGVWDLTQEYFLFTKANRLDNGFVNKNNIWIFRFGQSEAKQIFSTEDFNSLVYVSNGEKVAFVTKNKIGLINLDGSNLKYIYEFSEFDSRSEDIYVPTIQLLSNSSFKINIKLPNYFLDGAEENIEFDFQGNILSKN